jgi:hypothetical protein
MKVLPVYTSIVSILIGIALLATGPEAYGWVNAGAAIEGWVHAGTILIALCLIAAGLTWLWKLSGFRGLNSK